MNKSFQCIRDKKSSLGSRIHSYRMAIDGEGRKFEVCDKCANCSVSSFKKKMTTQQEKDIN